MLIPSFSPRYTALEKKNKIKKKKKINKKKKKSNLDNNSTIVLKDILKSK
jgi:hypothetical protein